MKIEIKKLDDILKWADGLIRDGGYNEEKYRDDASTAYCSVKAHELWKIRDVVLKGMERHTVYTNALNKDIADKAAKIDLLEKEIEGRKAGYAALKAQMDSVKKELEDTKEALDKTIESWVPLNAHDKVVDDLKDAIKERDKKIVELEKELADCKVKIRHQKENLDGINKTLEIKTKENERLIAVKKNQDKEIEAHESENARLSEKIAELKKERDKHMARVNDLRMELDCVKASKEKHEEAARDKTIEDLRESFNYWRTQCLAAQEARDAFMKEAEELKEENSRLNARVKCDTEYWKKAFEAQSKELEGYKDRDENAKDLLNNNSKEIKELKEENSYLKKESKNKSEMIRKAYVRYVDEACKGREEIMNECYKKLAKDDTGYTGFKQYTLRALEAQEGDEKKTKEFLCDSAEIIFYNKRAEEKRKEGTERSFWCSLW